MPNNKAHHFVPQFYLRNFGAGKAVAVYNIRQQRHIYPASIAGQAQRAYLYGKDGQKEGELQTIETAAAPTVRSIIQGDSIAQLDVADRSRLLRLISYQMGRTPDEIAVQRLIRKKVTGAINDIASWMKVQSSVEEEIQKDDLMEFNFGLARDAPAILQDLRMLLLVNHTDYDFVTSDCPAIVFNPWCRGWKASGVTGLASAGLVIFFPISPRHLLLLADPEVYSFAGERQGRIRVRQYRDVLAMNASQLLGARSNLYYRNDPETKNEIDRLPWRWHRPRAERVRVSISRSDDESFLVMFFQQLPDVNIKLSFLRVAPTHQRTTLKMRANSRRAAAELEADRLEDPADRPGPPGYPGQRWTVVDDR